MSGEYVFPPDHDPILSLPGPLTEHPQDAARIGHKRLKIGREYGTYSCLDPLGHLNPVLPTATIQELHRRGYKVSEDGGWFPRSRYTTIVSWE